MHSGGTRFLMSETTKKPPANPMLMAAIAITLEDYTHLLEDF